MVNERRRLYGYQPKENFVLAVITLHNFKVAIFSRRSIIATSGRRFSFRVQISTADKALVLLAVIKLAHFYSLLNHDCHRAWPNRNRKQSQMGTLKIVRRPKSAQWKDVRASTSARNVNGWEIMVFGESWLDGSGWADAPPLEIRSRKWLSCCNNIKSSGERTL